MFWNRKRREKNTTYLLYLFDEKDTKHFPHSSKGLEIISLNNEIPRVGDELNLENDIVGDYAVKKVTRYVNIHFKDPSHFCEGSKEIMYDVHAYKIYPNN